MQPLRAQWATKEDLNSIMMKLKLWIDKNGKIIRKGDEDDAFDWMFMIPIEKWKELDSYLSLIYSGKILTPLDKEKIALVRARYFAERNKTLAWMTMDYPDNQWILILWNDKLDRVKIPTVFKDSIRLPKLSYLITLTPEHFFDFIRMVANAEVSGGRSLKLDFKAIGKEEIMDEEGDAMDGSFGYSDMPWFEKFFQKLRVHYVIRQEIAMKQRILISSLQPLVDLEPTIENHLYAMQYLTVITQYDVDTMPAESAIELALDWDQGYDENYVFRPEGF